MNEYTKAILKKIAAAVLFVLFVACVVVGQKTVGYAPLGLMLFGLAGILALLYVYNRSYNRGGR